MENYKNQHPKKCACGLRVVVVYEKFQLEGLWLGKIWCFRSVIAYGRWSLARGGHTWIRLDYKVVHIKYGGARVVQWWRSGESARLPPMWPGFQSWRQRHMWVEFVVGSLLCSERFFSGYSGFPLSSKTNTSKFQFDLECTDTFKQVHMNS